MSTKRGCLPLAGAALYICGLLGLAFARVVVRRCRRWAICRWALGQVQRPRRT